MDGDIPAGNEIMEEVGGGMPEDESRSDGWFFSPVSLLRTAAATLLGLKEFAPESTAH